jgi:hypothetical protein
MSLVVFISYSRKDDDLKNRLLKQLGVLEAEGLIGIAVDDRIPTGADWLQRINESLLEADVAILLVTSSFLTSPFIREREVPELLRRREAGGLAILPLIAESCPWQYVSWLAKLNVFPRGGTPIFAGSAAEANQYLAELAGVVADLARPTRQGTPLIAAAVGDLDRQFNASLDAAHSVSTSDIDQILRTAIAHGAPIYDQGGREACARIYEHAARKALSQAHAALASAAMPMMVMEGVEMDGPRSAPMATSGAGMPATRMRPVSPPARLDGPTRQFLEASRFDLGQTLDWAETSGRRAREDIAWLFRRCFNRLLFQAESISQSS